MATAGNIITKANFTNASWTYQELRFRDGGPDYTYLYVYAPSIVVKVRNAPKPNWFASSVTSETSFSVYNGSSWESKGSFTLSAGNSEAIGWRQFNFNNNNGTFGENSAAYTLWEIRLRNTGSYAARVHGWVWIGGIGLANTHGTSEVYNAYCKDKLIRGNGSLSLAPLVYHPSSATTGNRSTAVNHFNPAKAKDSPILAAKEEIIVWPGYSYPN